MKRISSILFILAVAFSLWGCNRPRVIPQDKFEDIIYDLYLSNIYLNENLELPPDSVDAYAPVLKKYGYSASDIRYTMESYSKRKSVRMSDILDTVALRLQAQADFYSARLALTDSIDQYVSRRYKVVVLRRDSAKVYTGPSDPEKGDVIVGSVLPGKYRIEFTYLLDTISVNSGIYYRHFLSDSTGAKFDVISRYYSRGARKRETLDYQVSDTTGKNLELQFAYVYARVANQKFKLTIDSLKITYFLSPEQGRELLVREMLPSVKYDSVYFRKHDAVQKIIGPLRPD